MNTITRRGRCEDCGHKAGAHHHECTVQTCGCDRSGDEFPRSLRVEATIDVCSDPPGHDPHLRLSTPWPDSILRQHHLWCLGYYDQERQRNHVTVEITEIGDTERCAVVGDERPCEFGCTSSNHDKRPGHDRR